MKSIQTCLTAAALWLLPSTSLIFELNASRELLSRRFEVKDSLEAIEFYFQKGWTDGLPVVPPTEDRIWEMLDYVKTETQSQANLVLFNPTIWKILVEI
ncbi:MAG TPA: hypothetical protein VNM22_05960 [Candidatus Limnocylindrales bacterium]|nr:hypothetical protein [Candidatus Limnocylindrales bacterium]